MSLIPTLVQTKGHEYKDSSSNCHTFLTHKQLFFTVTATSNSKPYIHTAAVTPAGCTFAPLMLSFIVAAQSCPLLDVNDTLLANCLILNNATKQQGKSGLIGPKGKRDHYLIAV